MLVCYAEAHPRRKVLFGRTRKCFGSEEDGAITIFACFMVFMMLMICGIAVDLMQNEMTRTRVQNTLDRAILAASDLDQPLPADDVVDDYFAKSGMTDFLDTVSITPGADQPTSNYRIVSAQARTRTPSPYMRLTGVSSLPVFTSGTAEEAIEKTEISLVLDISGSMRFNDRIGKLRVAANDFIAAVLEGSAADTTSMNIVPYAGQVNPGRFIFDRAGGVPFASFYTDNGGDDVPYGTFLKDEDGNDLTDEDGNPIFLPYNQISSCLELSSADFDNINLPSGGYSQVAYFMNWPIDWPTMSWGWCPQDTNSIRYAQNNIGQLQTFINNIRLNDGTGTHYGMKYGVALLNPTSQSAFAAMNEEGIIPDAFADRPAAFDDTETRKVIVLMTDGKITDQYRPKVTVDPLNATDVLNQRTGDRTRYTKRSNNVSSFYAMCDDAKANGIQVYTIAFEAPDSAITEMKNCATALAFFYKVEGVEISSAFKSIARQINQLRLTQ